MINCRGDFPIFGDPNLVYLDSAATAQKPIAVIEKVNELHRTCNANIHRGIYDMAERTTAMYEAARDTVQRFIGAGDRSEIIFTSGATASLNLAAHSLCKLLLKSGDNVLISQMEHHSNIVPWQLQCEQCNANLRYIKIDEAGEFEADWACLIDDRTKVVALTSESNVLGTQPNLKPIIDAAHAVGAVVVVDGCQSVVHNVTDVVALGCDFYAFSGHKLYAPTGIGVLYGKRSYLEKMPPYMGGGDMIGTVSLDSGSTWAELPLKFEAGTANFIGAIGLAAAIDYINKFSFNDINAHEMGLYNLFVAELISRVAGVKIYGNSPAKGAICSFNVDGCSPFDIATIIDKAGVCLRSGTHCAEPVMARYGVRGMCRASFAIYNNDQDCIRAVEAIEKAVKILR